MVDILLATYNGEKYLCEQLDSLLQQTAADEIRILVRDDGSIDNTVSLIMSYCIKYPDKVILITDDIHCGSPTKNFMQLVKNATSDYVMFCDQDDVWLPRKVEVMLGEILKLNPVLPCLIYSDYIAVNEDLSVVNGLRGGLQTKSHIIDLAHLLVQNYITGCCIMVNRPLYSQICIFNDEILMHDWWTALYASAFGTIKHIAEGLMLYRQHSGQVVGSVRVTSIKYIMKKLYNGESRNSMKQYLVQAELFMSVYGTKLTNNKRKVLSDFIDIPKHRKIMRMATLIRQGYVKSTFPRIVGQLWYI